MVYIHRLMHRIFLIVFQFFIAGIMIPFSCSAQVIGNKYFVAQDSIKFLLQAISNTRIDQNKIYLNQRIIDQFKQVLSDPESFTFPFDSLKSFGKVYAPDKSFRLITWDIVSEAGNYNYFGFIQYFSGKEHHYKFLPLIEKTDEITDPENTVLSSFKWYGGLYYKILVNKIDNKTYYTLLAVQFHDMLLTRKFIEVLFFDEWNNPDLGLL